MTTIQPMLVNAKDAAKALGISERTLWQYTFGNVAEESRIPAVRIGNRVRYDVNDLRAFIERRKTCKASPTAGEKE